MYGNSDPGLLIVLALKTSLGHLPIKTRTRSNKGVHNESSNRSYRCLDVHALAIYGARLVRRNKRKSSEDRLEHAWSKGCVLMLPGMGVLVLRVVMASITAFYGCIRRLFSCVFCQTRARVHASPLCTTIAYERRAQVYDSVPGAIKAWVT